MCGSGSNVRIFRSMVFTFFYHVQVQTLYPGHFQFHNFNNFNLTFIYSLSHFIREPFQGMATALKQ